MPVFQTSITSRQDEFTLGQVVTDIEYSATKAARGLVKAGYGVFKVAGVGGAGTNMLDPGEVYHQPSPAAAADVDAIITAITSSTSIQSFSGATLNGAVGATEMQPARNVTLVLSNHADWDASNATLIGINHLGQRVTETLAIPNGGNATVTSTNRYRSVTSLSIPVQSGVGGTATVGISALATLTIADFRGVALRQIAKETWSSSDIYRQTAGGVALSATADYIDGDSVPVARSGGFCVFTEEVVADQDPVYVRIAAGSGGSVLGAFRNDDDTSTCVLVTDAVFCRDSAAGKAWAEFNKRG
jgi:hypothetical protein